MLEPIHESTVEVAVTDDELDQLRRMALEEQVEVAQVAHFALSEGLHSVDLTEEIFGPSEAYARDVSFHDYVEESLASPEPQEADFSNERLEVALRSANEGLEALARKLDQVVAQTEKSNIRLSALNDWNLANSD